ncbi:MAG: HD domain-containing protein [Hyphomonadaceae bacterium]|nr:HD domain-containing protein [Clostridia bacterium]
MLHGFFLIKYAQIKQSTNGKSYLDLTLADQTGEINAKKWDLNDQDAEICAVQTLVKTRAVVNEFKGQMQLKIEKIRAVQKEDGVSMSDFIPSAPESAEAMYQFILEIVNHMTDTDIKNIVYHILTRFEDRLLTYPGAVKNHHAIRSGLLYHIKTMLFGATKMVEVYPYLRADLLYAGVILHDMAKILEIEASDLGIATEFTIEGHLLGHIIQGVQVITDAAREVNAPQELTLLLQHMILSHHNLPEYGSPRYPMFPEAEMLHHLDLVDARMYDIKNAMDSALPGQLSDRIWTLENRRVYHPRFEIAQTTEQE